MKTKKYRLFLSILTLIVFVGFFAFEFVLPRKILNAVDKHVVKADTGSSCICHNKSTFDKEFLIPDKDTSEHLFSMIKKQKIYNDYKKFLQSKGYIEYYDNAKIGFFKKGIPFERIKSSCVKQKSFYKAKIRKTRPFLAVIPYLNPSDKHEIAGIVFVYSNQYILSFIVKTEILNNQHSHKIYSEILLENENSEIVEARKIPQSDSIIDWQCMNHCIPFALKECIPYMVFPPLYADCAAAAWGMCYDMCTLSKP